jgi:nucleotide-binding universal stress UspA family protein
VHAWAYPYAADMAFMATNAVDRDELAAEAKEVLAASLSDALGADIGDLFVSEVVEQGSAAEVLVRGAADAALLVVGTRGRGGFTGLLLGSVSQQCAHDVACPLVIVPAP